MDHFSKILNSYDDNIDLKPDDFQCVLELIALHPDAQRKIGAGIKRIYCGPSPNGPTRSFFFERKDGTVDDFSFPKVLRSI